MRGCGRIARPAFPAPSSRLRDEPSGTTRAHSCRENAEVWVSFSRATFCRLQPFARLHPSPVFVGRVAHRERSDTMCRVGACPRERILTSPPPRPPLRCGRPSPLNTKGGGIRKSELSPVFSHHVASNAKRLRTGAKRPGDPRSALSPDERRSVGGIAAPYFAVIASEAKQSIFDLAMACHGLLS